MRYFLICSIKYFQVPHFITSQAIIKSQYCEFFQFPPKIGFVTWQFCLSSKIIIELTPQLQLRKKSTVIRLHMIISNLIRMDITEIIYNLQYTSQHKLPSLTSITTSRVQLLADLYQLVYGDAPSVLVVRLLTGLRPPRPQPRTDES